MVQQIICVLGNYVILMYLNYKWVADGLHIKRVKANKVLTPILYYVFRPYDSRLKLKNRNKVYEFGLLLIETLSHLFLLSTIIDIVLLDGLLWHMQGWFGYIYAFIVPIVGVAYMIVNEIIKLIKRIRNTKNNTVDDSRP